MIDDTLEKKFRRLLRRLMDDCVVPFVGAGISMQARIPEDKKFEPTLEYMIKNLKDHFKEKFPFSCSREFDMSLVRDKHYEPISFDRLAEIGEWLWGQTEVCDILEIDKFASLEPLPAHQYLAYLAREGLVTEIVSTNYDCCLEKAFLGSFSNLDKGREALAVIRNLQEYRARGGDRKTSAPESRPVLHLYKINGCADRFRWEGDADQIILTERQLQNFRKEKWAEELFRDRARRRNFLFSGFGSEEPQIRHTALSISAEFTDNNKKNRTSEILDFPNAPFMTAYKKPSFTQLQIMVSFLRAHCPEYEINPTQNKMSCWNANTFTGDDAIQFGEKEKKLSANAFFKRLYQAAFKELVKLYSGPGSVFYDWLKRNTDHPRDWRTMLTHGFFHEEAANFEQDFNFSDLDTSADANKFLKMFVGRRRCLFELAHSGSSERCKANELRTMLLWLWLWRMRHPDNDLPEGSCMWYLPVREDPLFILTTLLFLVCLTSRFENGKAFLNCPAFLAAPRKGFGLGIKLDEPGKPRFKLYLVHESARFKQAGYRKEDKFNSRLARCVTIPSASFGDVKERMVAVGLGDERITNTKELWVGTRIFVSARDLVREASSPSDLKTIVRTHFAQIPLVRPKVRLERTR